MNLKYVYRALAVLCLVIHSACNFLPSLMTKGDRGLSSGKKPPGDEKKDTTSNNGGGNSGNNSSGTGFTLSGFIFNRDPLVDTNDFDIPLADIYQLPGQAASIPNLLTSGPLSNGLITISDTEFPNKLVTISASTTELPYTPKDPEFAQVNSYYHVNAIIQRLKGLSQFPTNYPALSVDAHCDVENNAYYDRQNALVCMGYSQIGNLKAYPSFDADVLTHELGHSLDAHLLSSFEVGQSWEYSAIDEGNADFWAFAMNGQDPNISYFFGRFIFESFGFLINGGENPLRDISTTRQYPSQVVNEEHDDSFFWSSTLYQLSKDPVFANDIGKLMKVVARVFGDLQKPANFAIANKALREEVAAAGANTAALDTFLTARGLLRRDDVTKLVLEVPATDVKVLDTDPFPEFGLGLIGNCNGALDVGEYVTLLVDFKNNGTQTLGNAYAILSTTAAAADFQIVPGGEIGFYTQFTPGNRFTQIPQMSLTASRYKYTLLGAVFLVKPKKVGTYNFSVVVTGSDSIDGNPISKTFNFSLTVGNSAANQCGG